MLIVAHDDNYAHIVINSIRDKERDKQEWMMKNKHGDIHKWEYGAGYKHQSGDHFLNYLRRETMNFCQERGLGQIDLFKTTGEKRTDKEYFVEKKAAQKGKMTYKAYIRTVLRQAKQRCTSPEEFYQLLAENHIFCEKRGQTFRYKAAEAQRWIRESTLGDAYKMDEITKALNKNALQAYLFKKALKQAQEEENMYVEAWRNKKGIHYTVSLYDDDGRKRGLLEQLLILAVVRIKSFELRIISQSCIKLCGCCSFLYCDFILGGR
nr:relaxase/mobilization nuclease domain-containing protein [Peribacillus faecalis]